MIKEPHVALCDIATSMSEAIDLVHPALVDHHKQVAFIAFSIAEELSLELQERNTVALAGMLHDSGTLSVEQRLTALEFEDSQKPQIHQHAEVGYSLFKDVAPFSSAAHFIRYHHTPWKKDIRSWFRDQDVPLGSQILHLADRTAVLVRKDEEVLGQIKKIIPRISQQSGKMFAPQLVDVFLKLADRESFWLDLVFQPLKAIISSRGQPMIVKLDPDALLDVTEVFSHIIDFRSPFTATHSSGIAAVAEELARMAGFSKRECQIMRVAGYVHDLGKLAVPVDVLEKSGKLTQKEFDLIRSHTYHTYRILNAVPGLENIIRLLL